MSNKIKNLSYAMCYPFFLSTQLKGRYIMKKIQQGFTLIELMIVVAIIGILASISLPAYNNYMTRTRVSEVMLALGPARTEVTEKVTFLGKFPAAGTGTDELTVTSQTSKYVASVAYTKTTNLVGVITVTAQDLGSGTSSDTGAIILTGTIVVGSPGQITWACTSTSIDQEYLPSDCVSTAAADA